jgi:microsomal dipeptidase-like Zn-dependent dipeptidase
MVWRRGFLGLLAAICLASNAAAAPPANPPLGASADTSVPGQVTLTWLAVTGADAYRIYRKVDPLIQFVFIPPAPPQWQFIVPVSPVATATGLSYTDTGLPPLMRQFYVVTAVNDDGESPLGVLVTQREVRVTAPPGAAVFGFADMHSHQFSNLGFGGKVVFGQAFSSGGESTALPVCESVHGFAGLADIVGTATNENLGHHTGGYPNFDGWPGWHDHTHQQMYVDWVRRAYEGGLRLMVVHAVNNKILCVANGPASGQSCDDMPAVDLQIQAAKDMEAFVDTQSGGPGKGWYRIAHSATEARHIINGGGLAVVLGMEVDEPFGCSVGGSCTDADVDAALTDYYAKGVRHFFPVHVIDNAFGGSAMYEPLFTYANKIVTGGDFFGQRDCGADGFGYKTGQASPLLTLLGALVGTGTAPTTSFAADCNDRTLQPLGESLLHGLMRRKMIVDLDHMDALTAGQVLTIAEGEHYPLVAGHTGILGVTIGMKRHEGLKTASQLLRMKNLGGMVATGLHVGTNQEVAYGPAASFNDCSNSSKTWAQAYMAAVDAMGGTATAAVGLGSDFNGLAGTLGPRFGAEACTGNATIVPQSAKLNYPFAIETAPGMAAGSAGTLGRMALASREYRDENNQALRGYDFNYDGLPHAGLLPDFLADLRSVLPAAYMRPLFRSAEGYLQVWEAIERSQVFRPTIALTTTPAAPVSGWFAGDVTVNMVGTPNATAGGTVDAIRYSASGALDLAETSEPAAQASLVVGSEGTTTVTATAEDNFGTRSLPGTIGLRIDRTGPIPVCDLPDGQWHADNVTLQCSASDALSGLAHAADAAFALSTSVPAGVETADAATGSRSLLDVAGNASNAGPIHGNRVDRKGPSIDIVVPAAVAYAINQPVAASYGCSDGGSGLATCAGPVPSGAAVDTAAPGTKTFTVDATDAVQNPSSRSVSYDVAYNVCLLYDATKVKKLGSTVPIKLQACDSGHANLSRPDLAVMATSVVMISGNTSGPLDDSGNANPDANFRYDASLPGYVFNLKTTGLAPGTWELRFRIAGDPTEHGAGFQIR